MESLSLDANGFTFEALAAGPRDGRAVMLLHGFPESSLSWGQELEALGAAGHRALAFDQRGYSPGARPDDVEDYRLDLLVADALAVADSQGWDSFDVVGHDWGAVVAWGLAALHPERIRTLCAVSVPHPGAFGSALSDAGSDQQQRSSYIEVFRAEGAVAERILLGEDGSGKGLFQMFESTGLDPGREDTKAFVAAMTEPGALTAALNWYRAMSVEAFLGIGPVEVPTLFVWSTEDPAIGRKGAEETERWVTGPYRFEVLEGVTHWVPETAAEELNRFLLEHLGTHR